MLVRHASGIDLLASSREFSDARSVTASGVKHVLSLSQALYRNVVVDLEDGFHPEQVEALRRASGLLLVCHLDFTALRNARRLLDHFARLDVPRDRIRLVVNKRGHPGELPVAEAEDALGERLTAFVPYDPKTVNDANNAGVLLVLRHAKAKVAKSILELANIDFSQQKGTSSILPHITQMLSNVVKGRGTA
jgi:pilus assembly protein CpaE